MGCCVLLTALYAKKIPSSKNTLVPATILENSLDHEIFYQKFSSSFINYMRRETGKGNCMRRETGNSLDHEIFYQKFSSSFINYMRRETAIQGKLHFQLFFSKCTIVTVASLLLRLIFQSLCFYFVFSQMKLPSSMRKIVSFASMVSRQMEIP